MKKRSRLKKGLAILLAIAMVVGLVPGVGTMKVSAEEITTSKPSGEGTANNPYQIGTAAELYWFAEQVNTGSRGINAVLTANITVNTGVLNTNGVLNTEQASTFIAWKPIGKYTNQYTGTFDGKGKTISGLYFSDTNTAHVGLFGGNGGTIKNVGVVDSCLKGKEIVGGVCGYNGGTITNCHNTGGVTVNGRDAEVGGVCGFNQGGTITNCYNTGGVTVNGNDAEVGGVCGWSSGTITNCYNTGGVTAIGSNATVGGVCGYQGGTITNCYYLAGEKDDNGGKTTAQFNSGEVAYLLSQGCTIDNTTYKGDVWGQDLSDENSYPLLDSTKKVYGGYENCDESKDKIYSNTNTELPSKRPDHDFTGNNGFCEICGTYQHAELNGSTYEIGNAGQFCWFAGLVNGDSRVCTGDVKQNKAAKAVLTADIDLSGIDNWTPIGNEGNQYIGTFDGQNHTIKNMSITKQGNNSGLFGYTANAAIKNIIITGKITITAESYTEGYGSIAGRTDNTTTVTNCHSSVNITINSTMESTAGDCIGHIGGIVGKMHDGDSAISNCSYSGTIELNDKPVKVAAGIAGYAINSTVPITNCSFTGNINSTYTGATIIGGIFGYTRSAGDVKVTNCLSVGTISNSGDTSLTGILIGWINNGYGNNAVKNNYYSSSSSLNVFGSITGTPTTTPATSCTTEKLASGEVCYLLNGSKTDSPVWYQNLENGAVDAYPVLDSTHETVYASAPCPSKFSNTDNLEPIAHIFIKVDDDKHKCRNCDLEVAHSTSTFTYAADEETHSITVKCGDDCGKEYGTVTLSAPTGDLTYDGSAKAASVTSTVTLDTFTKLDITYKKKIADQSTDLGTTAPTNAGTYIASISLTDTAGTKTVSVEYTISPATPTITWASNSKTVNYTGDVISIEKIGAPTVTLVNGESYEGTIQYSYRAKDSSGEFTSGLPTEVGTYEVKASVAADGNYTAAESTMTLTIGWLSAVSDATLKDQDGKELTGNTWWAQSVTFTPPEGFTICNSVDGIYADSFTFDTVTGQEGTEVTYYLKNSAGEIAKKTATVRVDRTEPDWTDDGISIKTNKWKELLNTISFGLFYKEEVDVTVSASDSLSGVAKYYYYVDKSGSTTVKSETDLDALAQDGSSFTEYAVSDENASQTITSLSGDDNYVVYVYAIDQAGNKSAYICSNGVVIDKTAPTISNISTPSKGSGDDDATLTDTGADMTFTASEGGTYFYIAKEGSEGAPTAIADFAVSSVDANTGMTVWTKKEGVAAATMTADGNNKISLSGLTANTAYTVYVIGVDQAGNVSDILSQTFTTCKTIADITTKPTIRGTYGTAVSAMTLTDGVAKVGDTVIEGTWKLTDTDASDVPGVGTTKTYEVTFTPDEKYNGQYDTVLVSVKPTVNAKEVTVTADNKTKTYGQDNPALTFTIPDGALVNGDAEAALAVTLKCEATKDSPVKEGGYAITGTSSSANYDVTVTPGTLTINQAPAEITVGETAYSKTFGDAAFDLGVTDNNTDEGADVTYAVSGSKNDAGTSVDDDKVITVDATGKVTIAGAGRATITASLAESNNFTAATSNTITITVAKKTGYTVNEIQESYLFSKNTDESIDLSKYIPDDCGTVAYGTPQTTGDLYADGKAPAITDGKLTYTVKQAETYGATGTIKVTVSSDNYADFVITVSLKLIDKIPVKLQSGSSVSLVSNTLTYGEALSTLTFNSAVFVDGDGTVVPGTLDWVDKTVKPTVAVTSVAWKFTPDDSDYETLSGNITIKVEKAEPNVKVLPTVAERTYHPTAKLSDTDLTGATVMDVNGVALTGTWSWENADVVPTVGNSGYEAVFTPTGADKDNYKTISKTITVNVAKATPYIKTAPTAAAITYGEILAKATLTGGSVQYSSTDDTTVDGTFAWKADTTKPAVADSNKTAYTVVFTPTNTNYNTVETDITVIVNKADTAPNKPDNTMEVDYTKEKVSDITTLPEGWAWQDADKDKALTVGTPVTATAVYTGEDAGNYVIESVEISITRLACTHTTTELRDEVAATCTVKGYTGDTYCKDCGAKLASGKEIEMTAHKWDAGKVTKEATETAEGVKTYTCSVCGTTKTEVIPKKTATTPQPPKKGDVVKDDKAAAKVEVADVTEKEVTYKESANKKAKTVTIPATVKIGGVTYKVTKISDNAFKNNKTVTKVTVGSNIKTIGKNAFYKCTKLKTLKIGKNVTEIGANAFKGCSSLTSVTLPSKTTKIGANAFNGCKKLKTIKITSTKLTSKTVAKNAFKGLTKATTIKVPKKKLSAYKKLFKQKGLSSKVKVKGY